MTWVDELREAISSHWARGESFHISEVYAFEHNLSKWHPRNADVRSKIRQVLQVLRDKGEIRFLDNRGEYRRIK
jgi:Dam-replacing HTH domain